VLSVATVVVVSVPAVATWAHHLWATVEVSVDRLVDRKLLHSQVSRLQWVQDLEAPMCLCNNLAVVISKAVTFKAVVV
jgi:hypothetical protein